ncbi:hypothetical protein ACS0TY_017550 [Phlomoides rotata]
MISVILAFSSCLASINSQPFDYPTANLSTSWINSVSADNSVSFTDNSTVRAILLRGTFGSKFACGFYCNGNCETYLFAIFIVQTKLGGGITSPNKAFPQVVWSANRNNPVRINATVELTGTGDLILRDADGTLAWSTNTAGRSVAGLNLTEKGNLILFDAKNFIVWQSFDHPTDALVPGQILVSGMNLTSSSSLTNWTEGGVYSFSMTDIGLVASIQSDPPLIYYYHNISAGTKQSVKASYVKYRNGVDNSDRSVYFLQTNSAQYMKLGPDGHLRACHRGELWMELDDIFTSSEYHSECQYPMACGKYGICSNGQCSCPNGMSFREITNRRPDLGCSQVIPVNCNDSSKHSFLDLIDVTYFTFILDIRSTNMNSVKRPA